MPAPLLDAPKISRRFGDRTVLDGVDVRVDAGSRIGLVGPNGSGKSTLLRIMAGRESADDGVVRRFGSVGYLPRMAAEDGRALTVRDTILEQPPRHRVAGGPAGRADSVAGSARRRHP